uniref:H0811D08.12 protein n=1 Tax=Oryza sativa TaxID=4530 RepID=Q25A13_ORYSA|nr:H0821G03.3 [Oryza sativa]CAJ86116.1 H0811D08.12 [Oryza sativa]
MAVALARLAVTGDARTADDEDARSGEDGGSGGRNRTAGAGGAARGELALSQGTQGGVKEWVRGVVRERIQGGN